MLTDNLIIKAVLLLHASGDFGLELSRKRDKELTVSAGRCVMDRYSDNKIFPKVIIGL